jgi:DNA-binding CsgD family transcriptional regulator/PAS domain-containing protein
MADAAAASQMREILDIVSHSHAAVMVLKVPTQIITAASPGAHELLDSIAQPLIGRSLHEFAEGPPSGAMALLADGRITGYETAQVLKTTGQRRRLWIRALPNVGPTDVVIAVLLKEDATGRAFVPWQDDDGSSPVIGSTDARLMIDRVSSEITEAFGYSANQLLGTSLLAMMAPPDIPEVLSALAQTSKHREGVTLRVGVLRADLVAVTCQLVLLPLTPAPSCAFALLTEDSDGPADGRAVADLITHLSRGIRGAMTSQAAASAPWRPDVDLTRLSSRELEVVALLIAGERVSAIAKMLFLSEGTVRNYLSSIFGKLGVGTQQELIALLRHAPEVAQTRGSGPRS